MSDENINAGSVNAGSPANTNTVAPTNNSGDSGKSAIDLSNYVSKADYEELEKKLGENSGELGGLRKFFEEVQPLLEVLQDKPDVIEAIIAGKIDSKLAQAVMEGKVKLEDATVVAQAHAQVKDDVGKDKYDKLTPEQIGKLVQDKVAESINPIIERMGKSEQNLNKTILESRERQEFEDKINTFVKNTPDLPDYAADIDKWFDEHPDQSDIEVAYYAVKGKKTTAQAKTDSEIAIAEESKRIAANAGGGHSQGGTVINDPDLVDKLFGKVRNPNA